MKRNIVLKIAAIAAKSAASLAAVALAVLVLTRYEYIAEFTQIDNLIGILPVSLAIIFAGGIVVALWLPRTKKCAALALTFALCAAVSAALFPTALVGGWWIGDGRAEFAEVSPDLSVYAPFTNDNKLPVLGEKATLRLTGDLPVLDGALALYPVYTAVVQAVYDRAAYEQDRDSVMFTNTVKAYEAIISGERDVIFAAAPSAGQREAAKKAGADLVLTPIGKEAFVFLVGKENPTDNISIRQIHNIYTGKTAKWSTLGWKDGGDIVAFRRPEGSGSESGLQSVMRGYPLLKPQPLPDRSLAGEGSLMQQISAEYNGVQPALGYSYRFFANTMYPNDDCKILSINGVSPTPENISDETYPFTADFYAVTNGEPTGNTKKLIDWIRSPQGQRLITLSGYSPL